MNVDLPAPFGSGQAIAPARREGGRHIVEEDLRPVPHRDVVSGDHVELAMYCELKDTGRKPLILP